MSQGILMQEKLIASGRSRMIDTPLVRKIIRGLSAMI